MKGYEIAKDRYVVIEPGELEALEPKKTRTIEIEDFVELAQIDPVYYDHPYYLAPGAGGVKPYRLLLEAMRESGRVAIARVVIRSKEQLVALRPMGDALGMATMIFADEILPPDRIEEIKEAAEVKTTKRELEMAKQLIDSLAGDFEPDKYRDTYRQEILDLIERKAQGKEIAVQAPPEEQAAPAPDLMGALKASLEAVRAAEAEATAQPNRGLPRNPRRNRPAKPPPRNRAAPAQPPRSSRSSSPTLGAPSETHAQHRAAATPGSRRARRTQAGAAKRRMRAGERPRDAPLKRYRAKRDFQATPEPEGSGSPPADAPRFVIHEHHARRLHWDLRLERDGVLACWALPKGLPESPGENRFAAHTEDHPLEYLDFDGEIPRGEYGAGRSRSGTGEPTTV